MTAHARRFARWLRLVVTCLAFVLGSPTPALAVDPLDTIVLVAKRQEESPEESTVEAVSAGPSPSTASDDVVVASFESPLFVSRRYIANCALLL